MFIIKKKIEQSMSQQTQNIFIPFVQRRLTMSSTLVQLCTNVIYIFCVYWGLIRTTHKQQHMLRRWDNIKTTWGMCTYLTLALLQRCIIW